MGHHLLAKFFPIPTVRRDNLPHDLFAGGILANTADMQKRNGATAPTGKATYEVWAFRVKDGSVVASSYNTDTNPAKRVNSLLTVNFNTGKLIDRKSVV